MAVIIVTKTITDVTKLILRPFSVGMDFYFERYSEGEQPNSCLKHFVK